MKESTEKTPAEKKKVEIPNTEVSKADSRAAQRYMVIMGLVIALIVIAGGYVTYRLVGEYVKQSNLNKAQDQLIAALQTKQQNLVTLKPNYEAITTKGQNNISDADLILRAVPITQDYENLIAILEKMGQSSNVKVTNVSQGASTSATTTSNTASTSGSSTAPTPFTFSLNVEGSYAAILDFLKKTEVSARVINFNSMTLSGNSGNIATTLTMTTNYQAEANISSTTKPLK